MYIIYFSPKSLEKATPNQQSAVEALASANQNIIGFIARRYSSSTENNDSSKKEANENAPAAMPNLQTNVTNNQAQTEEAVEPLAQSPQTPTSPSSMLNKLSPGNLLKNIFK